MSKPQSKPSQAATAQSPLAASLRTVFGLPADAPETIILSEATRCAELAKGVASFEEERAIIAAVISESCGALDEKRARQVIAHRGGFAAARAALAEKKNKP